MPKKTKTQVIEDEKKLKQEYIKILEARAYRQNYCKLYDLFPDDGPYRRELYPKHIAFLNAGAKYAQRAFIAGNRTGKTKTGCYELTLHLTGLYPEWWKGRRYNNAIDAWCASISNEATKNILQQELLGSPMDIGSGLIPKDLIEKVVKKPGVADAMESCYIKHVTGRLSRLDFKSYEQGRDTFQGTKKQVILLDEEPSDYGIFTECLTRTMDDKNPGIIVCTFTPLLGLSTVVLSFLSGGKFPPGGVDPENPHKYVTQVTWDEVPHLNEEQKKEMLASYSDYERAARSKGLPSLGSGAIYPYDEGMVVCEPFAIPQWWPRAYGLDVGWNKTAAVWGALDRDSDTIYLFSEHYLGESLPAIHASSIKSRGSWMLGACDPGAHSRNQVDGTKLFDVYYDEGLVLYPADNAVEAGIYKVGQLLATGRLKVFKTLQNWFSEYRVYRRDEKGKVVKSNDHLMDATRYLITTGMECAQVPPDYERDAIERSRPSQGRSKITGY